MFNHSKKRKKKRQLANSNITILRLWCSMNDRWTDLCCFNNSVVCEPANELLASQHILVSYGCGYTRYKISCRFCLRCSAGEYPVAYNLELKLYCEEGNEVNGKCDILVFFQNITCQIIGVSHICWWVLYSE